MSATLLPPVMSDDSGSFTLDENEAMHLRNLMFEQSDAGADVAAIEEEIDRCVRLEIVPSWDTLRDWCERLSDAADTADELPEFLNDLLRRAGGAGMRAHGETDQEHAARCNDVLP